LVTAYPNPTTNELYIDGQLNIVQAKLYNLKGQLILSEEVTNNRINLNSIENGTYFIKLVYSKGFKVVKIVKE